MGRMQAMGRLKGRALGSRLQKAGGRLQRAAPERGETPQRRSVDWLGTARWQRLRLRVLERDGYVCRQTGEHLDGKHPAWNSPVVDHIVPHRGDPALFWDMGNLQSVTKEWHDSVKQSLEKGGGGASSHPDWFRPSLVPLTIVCGPPASGKSRYVADRAAPGDEVIDLDVIAARMSGASLHGWDVSRWLAPALRARNARIGALGQAGRARGAAWLIVSEPLARRRSWWQSKLAPREIVVLEVSARQCWLNAQRDADRDAAVTWAAAEDWWAAYRRRPGERIVEWRPVGP